MGCPRRAPAAPRASQPLPAAHGTPPQGPRLPPARQPPPAAQAAPAGPRLPPVPGRPQGRNAFARTGYAARLCPASQGRGPGPLHLQKKLDIQPHLCYNIPCTVLDSLAQLAEHLTFNQGVRGSNPRWVTKRDPQGRMALGGFFCRFIPGRPGPCPWPWGLFFIIILQLGLQGQAAVAMGPTKGIPAQAHNGTCAAATQHGASTPGGAAAWGGPRPFPLWGNAVGAALPPASRREAPGPHGWAVGWGGLPGGAALAVSLGGPPIPGGGAGAGGRRLAQGPPGCLAASNTMAAALMAPTGRPGPGQGPLKAAALASGAQQLFGCRGACEACRQGQPGPQ